MGTAHPAKYLQQVEDACKRATFIIQKLTSTKEEMRASLPRGTESMPLSELHFCKGLAFTFVRKGGIGLSYEQGHGFVISKLAGDSVDPSAPSWSWSAPVFIDCYAGGLGLTLGFTDIESVMVLDTPEAVQGFTHTQVTLDTDITGTIGGALGTHLPATAANVTDMGLSDKTFTYSICKGAMIDVSLTGLSYTVDHTMMSALYGPGITPQAVLDGGVEPPAGMKELYSVLDHSLRQYYAAMHEAGSSAQQGDAPMEEPADAEQAVAPEAAAEEQPVAAAGEEIAPSTEAAVGGA